MRTCSIERMKRNRATEPEGQEMGVNESRDVGVREKGKNIIKPREDAVHYNHRLWYHVVGWCPA